MPNCYICLDNSIKNMKSISCCKKFCHDECINKWIKVLNCKNKCNLTCPYCRSILKQQSKISTPLQQIKLYSGKNESDNENEDDDYEDDDNEDDHNKDEIVFIIEKDLESDSDENF